MTEYNVTLSDGVTIINVPDGAISTAQTIPLIGQNATTYGDDVAGAMLRSLENFASPDAPNLNANLPGGAGRQALQGQLWYDNANNRLNVNTAATGVTPVWAPIASVGSGVTTNAMLRWSGTSWVEENQLRVTSGGAFSIHDAGGGDFVQFAHDGTNFNITSTNTSDIILGTTGTRLRLASTSDVSLASTNHPFQVGLDSGANIRIDNNEILAVNNGAASPLNLQTEGGDVFIAQGSGSSSLYIRERAAAAADAVGLGQIWVRNDSPNVLVFTDDTGTDFVLSTAGGASDHGALTGLGDDDHPQYAQIANTETISSVWTYTARPAFNSSGAPMTVSSSTLVSNLNADLLDGVQGSAYALDANVVHDTGNETIAGNKTFTDLVEIQEQGETIQLQGGFTSGSSSLQTYVGFRSSNNVLMATVGLSRSGSNELVLDGGSNGIALEGTDGNDKLVVGTTVNMFVGTSDLALVTAPIGASSNTTRARVYDSVGSGRSVGYNETPSVTISGSTYVMSVSDIGKFLTRTGSGTVAVRLDQIAGIPVGATFIVNNDNSSGSTSITQGSGVTLQWLDGGGSTPPTGTRTLAYAGVATVRKKSLSVYQIWGNGLS